MAPDEHPLQVRLELHDFIILETLAVQQTHLLGQPKTDVHIFQNENVKDSTFLGTKIYIKLFLEHIHAAPSNPHDNYIQPEPQPVPFRRFL